MSIKCLAREILPIKDVQRNILKLAEEHRDSNLNCGQEDF